MCTEAADRLAVALEGPWGQEGGFRVCVLPTNRKCLEVRGEMPGDAAEARGEGQDAVAGKGPKERLPRIGPGG